MVPMSAMLFLLSPSLMMLGEWGRQGNAADTLPTLTRASDSLYVLREHILCLPPISLSLPWCWIDRLDLLNLAELQIYSFHSVYWSTSFQYFWLCQKRKKKKDNNCSHQIIKDRLFLLLNQFLAFIIFSWLSYSYKSSNRALLSKLCSMVVSDSALSSIFWILQFHFLWMFLSFFQLLRQKTWTHLWLISLTENIKSIRISVFFFFRIISRI